MHRRGDVWLNFLIKRNGGGEDREQIISESRPRPEDGEIN
jgi:hypothetical protein